MALFSNFVALEGEKADYHCFHVEIGFNFEKRAANFIKNHKIANSTLKSAFGF